MESPTSSGRDISPNDKSAAEEVDWIMGEDWKEELAAAKVCCVTLSHEYSLDGLFQAEFLDGRSLSTLSTEEWTALKDVEHQLRLRKVQQKRDDLYAWMKASYPHCEVLTL